MVILFPKFCRCSDVTFWITWNKKKIQKGLEHFGQNLIELCCFESILSGGHPDGLTETQGYN